MLWDTYIRMEVHDMLGHGAILPLTYWGTFSQQPHQQCRNVPFSPYSHQLSHLHQHFAFLAIFRILQASHPRECRFMCISLMTSAAVHLFLSLLAICLSSLCWRCVGCKCSASFICRLSISWHGPVTGYCASPLKDLGFLIKKTTWLKMYGVYWVCFYETR